MANEEKGVHYNYNDIPCDFLGDILSRLDVKSLKRCECVSKSWLTLLRTPYFNDLHLKRQLHCVVFQQKKVRKFDHHLSICNGESFVEISLKKFPFTEMDQQPILTIMGSDNGVLGLYDLRSKVVYLWNPTINESKELTPSPELGCNHSELGVGYDPLTNDIKVVKFSSLDGNGVVSTCNKFKEGNQIGIYSLRSNSWKTMAMPNIFSEFESSSTFDITTYTYLDCSMVVNGCIHWIICFGNTTCYGKSSLGIIAFDTSKEKFNLIKSPLTVKPRNFRKLANFSGCLSFFIMNEFQVVDIWVMKKYGDSESWFQYLSVNLLSLLPNTLGQRSTCIPKGFLSNGNLVISCVETENWYCYDTKSKRVKNVGKRIGVSAFTTYVESTFKLDD
ncbi:F-box/kelch-repeat protein At3g23880-like [Cannabis sativa]|uniref:F-box/kelch-repeat protein At3g23880-like n=1 Tax=Cannabis sativa TaxID=3483 RepID=UPI0029CA17CE|nr:F-box/kelch-repeat protein At3g23880-like [Cannabis sativa]